ncbi:MAG: alpha-hydroxy-acid oxidizing protein [Gammaproteobacteria bacterium]|nr:alpha-hydroxy-acid oxidizing protein [Gammaproteobacteria bacterium]
MSTQLTNRAASIDSLQRLAKKRIPGFAWEYLSGGCNHDVAVQRNRSALDQVLLEPHYLDGQTLVSTSVDLLGTNYSAPLGVAPLGLGGIIWPHAAEAHAEAARSLGIPYVLSTLATTSIETAAKCAGESLWFQLYPPKDETIRADLIQRALAVGCRHLVVTIDVPVAGRRPRDMQNGLAIPPRIDARSVFQAACRPAWSVATLRAGLPQFASIMPYVDPGASLSEIADYIRIQLKAVVDRKLLQTIRESWPHQLIVKGILNPADARIAVECGADAIIVSNHGGRQLDAAVATIDRLPHIIETVGEKTTVMVDSGVESGVDIARFIASGAALVFSGRAFMYGVGAFGPAGAVHAGQLLCSEFEQVMSQLRCATPAELSKHLVKN